jgi:hypothetical protein
LSRFSRATLSKKSRRKARWRKKSREYFRAFH